MFLSLRSQNKKVGRVAATYLPFRTCPPSCPLRHGACYAMGVLDVCSVVKRIDKATSDLSPDALIQGEAAEILDACRESKRAFKKTPLRLHVSGDVIDENSTRTLAYAAQAWTERGGGPVWTYTHRWRSIPRWCWRPAISVWASVDNPKQGVMAFRMGYPSAIVVPYFEGRKGWDEEGIRWIACPAQTRGLKCSQCRICWKSSKMLQARRGVAFEAHGGCIGKGKAQAVARVLLGEQLGLFDDVGGAG